MKNIKQLQEEKAIATFNMWEARRKRWAEFKKNNPKKAKAWATKQPKTISQIKK